MHTDRYTRIMLTIIAAALVWICLRDTAPPAYAFEVGAEQVESIQRDVRNIANGLCLNGKIC